MNGYIGYHPLNPEIIFNSEKTGLSLPNTYISYNGGVSWEDLSPVFGDDNSVKRIAFHPTNASKWIIGGSSAIYKSDDNGQTWNTQNFSSDNIRNAVWCFAAYDSNNSDVIYVVGHTNDSITVMCSLDGGNTWGVPQAELMKKSSLEIINDLKQSCDKLFVYTRSDVYEISKAELLAQSTSAHSITVSTQISSVYYDLLGRRVDSPSGLTIVVTRYSDGSVRTDKKLFR